MTAEETTNRTIHFRLPNLEDGARIFCLIESCKPLDLNSSYLYLLLSHHFSQTCVIAEDGERLLGVATAYRPPEKPDVLFIWQIGVAPTARGRGIAIEMLEEILKRPQCRNISYVEATVSPVNHASRHLFHALARKLETDLSETPLFKKQHFPNQQHEEENLLRVGPFKAPKNFQRGEI